MLILLWACAPPPPSYCADRGEALGTTWSIRVEAPRCAPLRPVVERVLEEVDRQMSTWRDDSELAAIRRGGQVRVSTATASVVRHALAIAALTEGAYDPTVQPLMELWGFHDRSAEHTAPTDAELAATRARVGWDRVRVGADAHGAWVDAGGTALDLSSIAKGYAVDRISHALSLQGLANHMVEVGGEIRVAGEGPAGPWRLGVEAPEEGLAPGARVVAVVPLTNYGLATSGNYRNTIEVGGRRVHHTMDPRTGRPALTDVASASVVAPTAEQADALATAVMVLGADDGLALLERLPDVEGLVLVAAEQGWIQRRTSGMPGGAP